MYNLPLGRARTARARRPAARRRQRGLAMTLIAPTLQAFFTDRLTQQLQASPRTIASYRDTLRLLLGYAHDTTGKQPSALDWDDLDEPLIAGFLDHLDHDRHNTPRTRNLRLTAIRLLFKYAALRHPEHAAAIARMLAIPPKRSEKRTVSCLQTAGYVAHQRARPSSLGRPLRPRHAHLAIHTGLRVSELRLGCTVSRERRLEACRGLRRRSRQRLRPSLNCHRDATRVRRAPGFRAVDRDSRRRFRDALGARRAKARTFYGNVLALPLSAEYEWASSSEYEAGELTLQVRLASGDERQDRDDRAACG